MKKTISLILIMTCLMITVFSTIPSAGAAQFDPDPVVNEVYGQGSSDPLAVPGVYAPVPGAETSRSSETAAVKREHALAATGAGKTVTNYSYEIKPLLAPFNTFFFVKTDNPDPTSFRFVDSESVYYEEEDETDTISVYQDNFYRKLIFFADVQYEDESTGRVAGGYIFKCDHYNTDGGKITLQYLSGTAWWNEEWVDSDITLTLPKLKDNVDYLIDTYATKDSFFENMDAVQRGFEDICFYSGSYIRGEVKRTDPYWMLARAGHYDQSYYIYSPYDRDANLTLFASSIYPFRYDSLGFPGMMAAVSQRLDSSSTYEWTETHWLINVTYNGETKGYGGAGKIEGQGIDEKDIKRVFTLKADDPITFDGIAQLLKEYAALKIEDDIPRDDELTFRSICDTVGDGAWVRMCGSNMSSGGHHDVSNSDYTYLYSKSSTDYINDNEWGVGYRNYRGGKMGYFRGAWVDGRYVDEWRTFEQGAKFADHPNSDLFLIEHKIPLITYSSQYKYNYDKRKYELIYTVSGITKEKKNILYRYDSTDDKWYAAIDEIDRKYASYSNAKTLVENGVLDASYLDMLSLTRDQVLSMNVDKNTDTVPGQGYIFDGTAVPGTPFGFAYILGDVDTNGEINSLDVTYIQRVIASVENPLTDDEVRHGDVNRDGETNVYDVTAIQYYLACMDKGYKIGEIVKAD